MSNLGLGDNLRPSVVYASSEGSDEEEPLRQVL